MKPSHLAEADPIAQAREKNQVTAIVAAVPGVVFGAIAAGQHFTQEQGDFAFSPETTVKVLAVASIGSFAVSGLALVKSLVIGRSSGLQTPQNEIVQV